MAGLLDVVVDLVLGFMVVEIHCGLELFVDVDRVDFDQGESPGGGDRLVCALLMLDGLEIVG